jgi:hypothetical protein
MEKPKAENQFNHFKRGTNASLIANYFALHDHLRSRDGGAWPVSGSTFSYLDTLDGPGHHSRLRDAVCCLASVGENSIKFSSFDGTHPYALNNRDSRLDAHRQPRDSWLD